MSISISEPMRQALDALYEGRPASPEALAQLTDAEKAEVASLARTANITRASLNQPIPTAEMEAAALARAHQAMQQKKATAAAAQPQQTAPAPAPAREEEGGNWFTRLFGRKKSP